MTSLPSLAGTSTEGTQSGAWDGMCFSEKNLLSTPSGDRFIVSGLSRVWRLVGAKPPPRGLAQPLRGCPLTELDLSHSFGTNEVCLPGFGSREPGDERAVRRRQGLEVMEQVAAGARTEARAHLADVAQTAFVGDPEEQCAETVLALTPPIRPA